MHLSHTQINLYGYTCCPFVFVVHVLLACLFLRVPAHVQHMHSDKHMYFYTPMQVAMLFLVCVCCLPSFLRVFALVQPVHYLTHM